MNSILENLLMQPLFAGVGYERMSEIVGKYKVHFLKYTDGETIVHAHQPCTHIKFIISGQVRTKVCNNDARFTVSQTLTAPNVLAPSYLFGPSTEYPMTAVSLGSTSILQLTKKDYLEILASDKIFLLNFLNTLSANAQKSVDGIMSIASSTVEYRLAFWILSLSQPGGTDLCLECTHRALYSLFGVQRSSFIAALDELAQQGALTYTNNSIHFANRQTLCSILQSSDVAVLEEF